MDCLGASARIGVLDDGRCGLLEFLDQLPGGVQIHQVVVGELLALQLLGARDAALAAGIERGLLMRILAVAQIERARRANVEKRGQTGFIFGAHASQARADGAVVRGGQREGLLGQSPQRRFRKLAVAFVQLFENRRIVVGRNHHGDVLIVLGRRANQRGPADIDVLDQLRQRRRLVLAATFSNA